MTQLNVFLNNRLVGYLRKASSGAVSFQYAQTWLEWASAMPISLSLPLRDDSYSGDAVMAVFENLLPDNNVIRRNLAERFKVKSDNAYELLSVIGHDCVGALQFLPEKLIAPKITELSGTLLTNNEIAALLNHLKISPLGMSEDGDFRISLAGAQEKTALLFWNNRWYLPKRNTPTTHIIKPQIGKLQNNLDLSHSVENEHLCMAITAALGIPTAKTEIKQFDSTRALVVERFDRHWISDTQLLRLPQEDCCQALSILPFKKYEADGGPGILKILALLNDSDAPDHDRAIFMKTQVIFWLLAATDGHAKNFSLALGRGGRFVLTPIYDVISLQPNFDLGQVRKAKLKLAMAVGKNRHYAIESIVPRHFVQQAEMCGLPTGLMKSIFDDLIRTVPKALQESLSNLPKNFPEYISTSIERGINLRLALIKNWQDESKL